MERLDEDASSVVRPNVISYSTVMDAFCRHQNPNVARKLLARLVERYEQTQDERLRPNSVVYNCLLAAYAKSGKGTQAADLSLQLLNKMGDLADVISYNTVLHAMAKSGAPDAGERAQALIDAMHVAPNARTYSTVMDCWARSSHDDRATIVHDLLRQMERCYNTTGDDTMRPNVVSYSVAIHSYANSKDPHKAERAYQILKHMWVAPTLVTFNSVLNCCAASSSTPSINPYSIATNGRMSSRTGPCSRHVPMFSWAIPKHLSESNVFLKMPVKPDVSVLECAINSSRQHPPKYFGPCFLSERSRHTICNSMSRNFQRNGRETSRIGEVREKQGGRRYRARSE
jgi:pentatricopeptide repeat protein